ncbi:hypothetical protein LJB96_04580 [Methanobrevibacter sp. OttesenSCG-928-K11]|nr:hypothetical protein [Methanobrevibacter sp. OttesenSCG-928-K11]MDL2271085.1 hypothetical protein [Methanobrevibacter sp. OttesenSCG-928-I08]
MVNHSKIILAGVISGIVAITTWLLGITGTIIGSVVASVFYNVLSEFLEKPIENASMRKIELEIIYLLPIVVIFFIQFFLIIAIFAEQGILPYEFVGAYSFLQNLLNNNLYKLLGASLLVISIYPAIIKKENNLKKINNILIAFVGLIFLARGFLDVYHPIVDIYDDFFIAFDFPIAIIAFIILGYVIFNIAYDSYKTYYKSKKDISLDDLKLKKTHNSTFKTNKTHIKSSDNNFKNHKKDDSKKFKSDDRHQKSKEIQNNEKSVINTSVEDIEFVATDLWNVKKRKK